MIEIIITVVVLAIIFFVIAFAFKGDEMRALFAGKQKDMPQEKAAAKPFLSAKNFAAMQQYKIVSPVHIAKNGKFADADFALVGAFGVLCVKCIGLGGEIYAGDGKWLQIINEERKDIDNPIEKCASDTRAVREVLFDAKLKSIPVETVCVFTNPKTQLAVPRGAGHYTVKTFKKLLAKEKYLADKKVDIEKVAEVLNAAKQ